MGNCISPCEPSNEELHEAVEVGFYHNTNPQCIVAPSRSRYFSSIDDLQAVHEFLGNPQNRDGNLKQEDAVAWFNINEAQLNPVGMTDPCPCWGGIPGFTNCVDTSTGNIWDIDVCTLIDGLILGYIWDTFTAAPYNIDDFSGSNDNCTAGTYTGRIPRCSGIDDTNACIPMPDNNLCPVQELGQCLFTNCEEYATYFEALRAITEASDDPNDEYFIYAQLGNSTIFDPIWEQHNECYHVNILNNCNQIIECGPVRDSQFCRIIPQINHYEFLLL